MIKIFKLAPDAIIPVRATEGSAGYDLHYYGPQVTLRPATRQLLDTGVSFEMPPYVSAHICPRSGLSLKGIDIGAGIIDSDYRGPIKALLINNGEAPITFKHGDRIAQVLFLTVLDGAVEAVGSISETERGSGGFGSTGI